MKKSSLLSIFLGFFLVSGCSLQPSYHSATAFSKIPQEFLSLKAPKNFIEAKEEAWKIYAHHPESFYCQCGFTMQGQILPETCDYAPTKVNSRTYKVEWEHIVPAKVFGGNRICWLKNVCTKQDGTKYKGRACCAKVDEEFRRMEADLHNIVPEIGTLNQARGTYPFGMLTQPVEDFMGCPLKISKTEKKVEPRAEIRGLIARAYLYMSKIYGVILSEKDKNLYESWHRKYPPDEWEIEWDKRVKEIQGNSNIYIEN